MTQQHDAPEGGAAQPVAWRVKDFADSWILFSREKDALHEHQHTGALIQPLYLAPTPSAPSGLVDAVRAYQPTLVDMEVRVGGSYRMPDGRSFWIDGVTAREIAKRALGLSPSSNDRLQRRPV